MVLLLKDIQVFHDTVLGYYYEHQRDLLWRKPNACGTFDPYKIMVSEIMLQQTQVSRVIEKYRQFVDVFPTIHDLAAAPLQDVLLLWQGLGYNRRARFLREAALLVVQNNNGTMPSTLADLVALPGIGPNTASAILVYTHNQPLSFIETNIRAVYIHYFFNNSESVSDRDIITLVEQSMYIDNPREWYWALMDYGTYLKKSTVNPTRRSKHYVKQSRFEGSARQLRGEILRQLANGPRTEQDLENTLHDSRFSDVVTGLIKDQLIIRKTGTIQIAD